MKMFIFLLSFWPVLHSADYVRAAESGAVKSVAPSGGSAGSAGQDSSGKSQSSQKGSSASSAASNQEKSGSSSSGSQMDRTGRNGGDARGMSGGQSSENVKQVQEALKNKGHDPGAADGVMGPKTQQALRAFQKVNGLQPTGGYDDKTASALGVDASGSGKGQSETGVMAPRPVPPSGGRRAP